VLSASPADFRNIGDALAGLARRAHVAVLGSEQAIAAANVGRSEPLLVTKVI